MNPASRRFRPVPLAIVLALHGGALWALTQPVSDLPIEPPRPPVLVANLLAAAAPAPTPTPAPPAPAARVRQPRPAPAKPTPVATVTPTPSPIAAPASPPAPAEAPAVAAPTTAGGAPGAHAEPTRIAAASPAPAAPAAPRTVSSGIVYLRPPAPEYPSLSRRRGESGTVELRVLVDTAGVPQRVEVARSSGSERLDNAAAAAAMKALFRPHVIDGVAVPIWAVISTSFNLDA